MTGSTGWTFVGLDGVRRPAKLIGGVHDQMERVNAARQAAGRQPLTAQQAIDALAYKRLASPSEKLPEGDGLADFLIGLATGIPLPSMSGIAGAMLHHVDADSVASASVDTGVAKR